MSVRYGRLRMLVCAALALGGALAGDVAIADNWTVAAYICGDGDLARVAERYAEGLRVAAAANGWALRSQVDLPDGVTRQAVGSEGSETEWWRRGQINMCRREAVEDFLRWVRGRAVGDRLAFVVFGHGVAASGRTTERDRRYEAQGLALDASAGGDVLTPQELARAVAGAFGDAERPLDILVADCCYGASVEAAWSLRDAAEVMVGWPGRAPVAGVQWAGVQVRPVEGLSEAETLAMQCVELPRDGECKAAAVRLAALDGAIGALKDLSAALSGDMRSWCPGVTAARSQTQRFGPNGELCEVQGLCEALANGDGRALEEAERAAERLSAMGVGGLGCGLTVLMPMALEDVPAGYAGQAEGFGAASGWGRLIECYCGRLEQLLGRVTDNPEQEGGAG
ncbi:MAG: clostripain-related cysteine peptidase [Armatimonadota bacterium]|nr:clostripain-related cysteine peptidase [Armatimonadota bacterium]